MFHYQKQKTKLGEMFSMVLSMIACTDITHVVNIDVYLMKTMPELMSSSVVGKFMSKQLKSTVQKETAREVRLNNLTQAV